MEVLRFHIIQLIQILNVTGKCQVFLQFFSIQEILWISFMHIHTIQFIHVYIHALYIHIIHTHLLYIWHTEMMEKTNDVGQTAKEKALKINVELSWYILHLYS